MSYLVSALPDDELLLNCTDTVTSVLQNIKCIIQTRKGDIYLKLSVEVLPWVVRINDIEF